MISDLTFQPPIGIAPVVGFQAPVAVAPALGFQPPIGARPDVGLSRSGGFQAAIGLSTPLREYELGLRESLSLLNSSSESLAALRQRMSETVRPSSDTFRATTSETWRPSRYTFKTPDMAR